jgi:hypothetical protein
VSISFQAVLGGMVGAVIGILCSWLARPPWVTDGQIITGIFVLVVIGALAGGSLSAANSPSIPTGRPAEPTVPQGSSLEYQNVDFTLPGGTGSCNAFDSFHDGITFDAQGPRINATYSPEVDLDYNCARLQAVSNGTQIALSNGAQDAAGCLTAVNRQPVESVPYADMYQGMRVCAVAGKSSQIVLLTLTSKRAASKALTWTATGWNLPHGG